MKTFVGGGLVVLLSISPVLAQERRGMEAEARLAKILEAAGDYCEKLKSMALNFVCRETIKEKTYEFGKTLTFRLGRNGPRRFVPVEDLRAVKTRKTSYVYDYQMIKKGEVFKEKRDLLEENGKKRDKKDVELQTLRMSARYLVYGPVGFLSRSWQPHFDYEIVGAEVIDGRKAVVVRAAPRESAGENQNIGRLWIDEATSGVLQIESEPRSILHYRESVQSPIGELKRRIAWTIRYGVIKNGVRFPDVQTLKETLLTPNGKEHVKYEASYLYDRYRYFTVETEVVVK